MKTFFMLIAVLFMNTSGFAADSTTTDPKSDAKKQEMMKAFEKYSKPGPSHKVLADMAGSWKYTSKWWESADGKPEESTGTSKMKMIMGGRWLQQETKGKAMGMPFEGMGLTGYDNLKEKYETLWLDNMVTRVMHGTGTFDSTTKTLSDSGTFSCPMSKSKDKMQTYRGEWILTDKNNMTYSMYGTGPDGGKEFKQMELIFKRVK